MEKTNTNKTKKILGIVVNVILWLFLIFSVVVTIFAVSASTNDNKLPTLGGNCYLSVLSGSMDATKPDWVAQDKPEGFKENSLIIGKYIYGNSDELNALSEGDIITFEYDVDHNGQIMPGEYNTHRIKSINKDANGKAVSFETVGDNDEYSHGVTETVSSGSVLAVYTGKKVNGLGGMLKFLGSQLGFGLCILLPLVAFFVYQLVVFVQAVIKMKNGNKRVITEADEEMIRRLAVEEYKRQQEALQNDKQGNNDDEN